MYWLYLWRPIERGWVDVDELLALAPDPRGYAEACTELHDALVCKVLRGAIDYACAVVADERVSPPPDSCPALVPESLLAHLRECLSARVLVRGWVLSRRSVVERLLLAASVEFPPPADVLPPWSSSPPLGGSVALAPPMVPTNPTIMDITTTATYCLARPTYRQTCNLG